MSRILIVDDSPTQAVALVKILEKNGHKVSLAGDGKTGITSARSENPDLILMDIVMPGMNGFQATRRIHNDPATKNIPVVLVSTKNQETDILWGKRQGAKGYLVKPVAEQDLISTITPLLADSVTID